MKKMTLDALHFVYKNPVATEKAIESFRRFYPSSNYIVMCDDGYNYSDMCERYNCDYIHYNIRVGYPKNPHGYRFNEMMLFLERFSAAVSRCKNSHILFMEDDVHVLNPIQFLNDDEMLVTKNCQNNFLHKDVLNLLKDLSGNTPDDFYGLGGGAVFKRDSFLTAYNKMKPVIESQFNQLQIVYPTIGWIDCILSVIMMSIGKKHKINAQYHDMCLWGEDYSKINYDCIDELKDSGISIVHHYKKYYDFKEIVE